MNEKEANMMMEKDGRIARLEAIIEGNESFQDILEAALAEKYGDIESLESTLTEKDEMIAELQEELCEQDKEIDELRDELCEQDKENGISRFFRRLCFSFRKRRSQWEW